MKVDKECPRWGTYKEKMRQVQSSLMEKDTKKKVNKAIDSILKESGMTRKEFDELKGVRREMKASGQTKILTPTPIAIFGPEVTIAQPCMQALVVPYAIIAQQQPAKKGKVIEEKEKIEITPPT